MRRLDKTISITSGGGVIVHSSAWELPALPGDARVAVQYVLEAMGGGTAPAVVTQLEVSNDGVAWSGLDVLGLAQSEATLSAVLLSKWLLTSDSRGTSRMWQVFRYFRLASVGAGTVPPTSYTVKACIAITFNL